MRQNVPVRYPSGVNSRRPSDTLGRAVMSITPGVYQYNMRGNGAENPAMTNTIASTGTAVLGNIVWGGGWLMNTAATAADTVQSQITGEAFQFVPGFPCWYSARVEVNSLTLAEFAHGVQITNANALAATDGVWFHKASGGTTVDLVMATAGVLTTVSSIIDLATLFANGSYTANISGGAVTSITVNTQPTGCIDGTSAIVTLTGGGGTGATAVAWASPNGQIAFQVIHGGSGYTGSPTVGLIPQVPMEFFWDGGNAINPQGTLSYGIGRSVLGSVRNPSLTPALLSPVVEVKASTAAVCTLNYANLLAGGYLPY